MKCDGDSDYFARQQVLYVDGHTPLGTYADPSIARLDRRPKGSCISFSSTLTRSVGRLSESWVTVSSDPLDCAIVDITVSPDDSDEYYIYMMGRVDGAPVTPGYLGTRLEDVDTRNSESFYLSATAEKISSFMLVPYGDGYLIKDSALDYYLLAGFDRQNPLYADGVTSDLILHGGQNGDYIYQTVFAIDYPAQDMATRVMATMMVLLPFIVYL